MILIRPPWNLLGSAIQNPATAYKFELYDVRHDWTQNVDVSAKYPQKVTEMKLVVAADMVLTLLCWGNNAGIRISG